MKTGLFKYFFGLLMIAIILGPQLYKTYHVVADHHGHLHCEAMHHDDDGLNSENDHCLICAFQLAVFAQPEMFTPEISINSFPQLKAETIEIFHASQLVYTYLLRGPPALGDFMGS